LDDFNHEGLGIDIGFSLPAKRVIRALNQIIEWCVSLKPIRVNKAPEYVSGTLIAWAEGKSIAPIHFQPDQAHAKTGADT
jgi:putative transposase